MNEPATLNEQSAIDTPVEPIPTPPADPMVSMIERLVLDPNADIEKLEKMLEMKERIEGQNQFREYSEAMSRAQAEMKPVARNKENKQTSSNYADLSAIYKACKPIAGEYGLSFSTYPEVSDKEKQMRVRWVVRHVSGHQETGYADLPIDAAGIAGKVNKTGIHAFGSTASYARRYLFCMIFDIATQDDDGNASASGEPITEEQYIELRDMIDKIPDLDEQVVLTAENLHLLTELPSSRFGAVVSNLRITAEKRGVDI